MYIETLNSIFGNSNQCHVRQGLQGVTLTTQATVHVEELARPVALVHF